jgi:hypothetical protein
VDYWTEDNAVRPIGDIKCVPLVRRNMELFAEIDLLFLRLGAPGGIIDSGDIDNRILTWRNAKIMGIAAAAPTVSTEEVGISAR